MQPFCQFCRIEGMKRESFVRRGWRTEEWLGFETWTLLDPTLSSGLSMIRKMKSALFSLYSKCG